MSVGSIAYNRHLRILDRLKEQGSVRVEELSELLHVSQVTVRRDLDYLNSKGFLTRTHGGAAALQQKYEIQPESGFNEKDVSYVQEKQRIAVKCAEIIAEHEIIFVNSGTTVLFFLQALQEKHVRVITNNAAVIEKKLDPRMEVMILGGEYREQSRSFVGEFAYNSLKNIYSSHTILGTNGVSIERGLTTTVYQECSINQSMIQNTHGKVIVLADHSKLGRISNFVSASLEDIDMLITDDCTETMHRELEAQGVQVILA